MKARTMSPTMNLTMNRTLRVTFRRSTAGALVAFFALASGGASFGCSGHRHKPRRDASVDPSVNCDGPDAGPGCEGTIEGTLSLDVCGPTALAVSPTRVRAGGVVYLQLLRMPDESEITRQTWSTDGQGEFAPSDDAATSFRCDAAGDVELSVETEDARGCVATSTVDIVCD